MSAMRLRYVARSIGPLQSVTPTESPVATRTVFLIAQTGNQIDTTQVDAGIRPMQLKRSVEFFDAKASRMLNVETKPRCVCLFWPP